MKLFQLLNESAKGMAGGRGRRASERCEIEKNKILVNGLKKTWDVAFAARKSVVETKNTMAVKVKQNIKPIDVSSLDDRLKPNGE